MRGAKIQTLKEKTAKGVSIFFYTCIFLGYLCGIASKLLLGSMTYVLFFYVLNAVMVFIGIVFYFRNVALDKARDAEAGERPEISQEG